MRSPWLPVAVLGSILYVAAVGSAAYAATITVRTGSYYFGDGSVSANVGDQLRFVIEDGGKGTPHTVEIDALDIHSGPIATKGSYTTPELLKPGTYRIYCKPHENKGHVGSLTVTGEAATTTTTVAATTTTTMPATTTSTSPTTTSTTTDSSSSTTIPVPTTTDASGGTSTTGASSTDPNGDTTTTEPRSLVTDSDGESGVPLFEGATTEVTGDAQAQALADDQVTESGVAIGVVEPSDVQWLRSIWLALILGIPLTALWIFVATRSTAVGVKAADAIDTGDDPAH